MRRLLAVGILALLAPATLGAEPPGDFTERWQLYLGGSIKRFDTGIRVDSETLGRTRRFRLEDTLGLEREQFNGRVWGSLRLGRRHRLSLDYTLWVRNSDRTLDEEFRVGDAVFPVGAFVRTHASIHSLQVLYRYSVLHGARGEAGLTVGVSAFLVGSEFRAGVMLGNTREETLSTADLIAPVPVLGIHGAFAPGGSIILRGTADFLYLTVSGWRADYLQASTSAEWYVLGQVGLGARFQILEVLVVEEDEPRKEYQVDQSGPEFFIAARF